MKRKTKERLQTVFHLYFINVLSWCLTLIAVVVGKFSKEKKLDYLLKAIRFNGKNTIAVSLLKKNLDKDSLSKLISKSGSQEESSAAGRSIVLSPPIIENGNVLKKGTLLITFTSSFSAFLNSEHFFDLDKRYLFILEPSWTGYADPDILYFCEVATDLVIQATDIDDRALINTIYPSVKTIDIGASNWVNPTKFIKSEDTNKSIDILYVANNNPIKRVFRLIELVDELKEKLTGLKVVVICASVGGKSNEVKREVSIRGLSETIDVRDGMRHIELIRLYNKAKISVLFSLKEGSNRVLFESLACDTPIFCVAENRGVNKSYINEQTGIIAYDNSCVDSLYQLIEDHNKYNAREWAVKNISPEVSTSRLQVLINNHFGEKINHDLKIKINDPEVKLLNAEFKKAKTIRDFFSN